MKDIEIISAWRTPPKEAAIELEGYNFRWSDGTYCLMIHAGAADPSRLSSFTPGRYSHQRSAQQIVDLLDKHWSEPNFVVEDKWRNGVLSLFSGRGIETIQVGAKGMGARAITDTVTSTQAADLFLYLPTNIERVAGFQRKAFLEVVKIADAFDFSAYPDRAVSFRFMDGRGVVIGQELNECGAWCGSLSL